MQGWKKKSTIDETKHLVNDYGSPSQKILIIKTLLKDPLFSSENDHADVVNMKKKIAYNSRVIKQNKE